MRYYVDVNAVQGGDGSSEKPFTMNSPEHSEAPECLGLLYHAPFKRITRTED